ncbi:hypothetical protein [Sulfoacidibacillus thermotolerans]|uniref:Uncharacterized protein n=1 Tax=Sulfoacidibacillus thermotolerans TaxID=1765684 RepID=A0A2U3D5L8_SULT2|nr:hypothetical protein [Sulfoacidibacillus thermotolerans]PWI56586.1 hypothetical protein BM613_13000 [Sulfoacidibacillus thermotolerans]
MGKIEISAAFLQELETKHNGEKANFLIVRKRKNKKRIRAQKEGTATFLSRSGGILMITFPFFWFTALIGSFFLIMFFEVGGFAFSQLWTHTALQQTVKAAMAESHSVQGVNGTGADVLVDDLSLSHAQQAWNNNTAAMKGVGVPLDPTFQFSTVNPNTPSGYNDTFSASVQATTPLNSLDHFMAHFGTSVQAERTITDTVSSTLPTSSEAQQSLQTLP